METCHSCPHPACHQTRFELPAATPLGWISPFRVGCHSLANWGWSVARSLTPGTTRFPVHTGHPAFLFVREVGGASHSWPHRPNHHTFRLLATVTVFGVREPFLLGCHSVATSGRSSASDRPGKGLRDVTCGFCHRRVLSRRGWSEMSPRGTMGSPQTVLKHGEPDEHSSDPEGPLAPVRLPDLATVAKLPARRGSNSHSVMGSAFHPSSLLKPKIPSLERCPRTCRRGFLSLRTVDS